MGGFFKAIKRGNSSRNSSLRSNTSRSGSLRSVGSRGGSLRSADGAGGVGVVVTAAASSTTTSAATAITPTAAAATASLVTAAAAAAAAGVSASASASSDILGDASHLAFELDGATEVEVEASAHLYTLRETSAFLPLLQLVWRDCLVRAAEGNEETAAAADSDGNGSGSKNSGAWSDGDPSAGGDGGFGNAIATTDAPAATAIATTATATATATAKTKTKTKRATGLGEVGGAGTSDAAAANGSQSRVGATIPSSYSSSFSTTTGGSRLGNNNNTSSSPSPGASFSSSSSSSSSNSSRTEEELSLLFRQLWAEFEAAYAANSLAQKYELLDELARASRGSLPLKRQFWKDKFCYRRVHSELVSHLTATTSYRQRPHRADEIQYALVLLDLLVTMMMGAESLSTRLTMLTEPAPDGIKTLLAACTPPPDVTDIPESERGSRDVAVLMADARNGTTRLVYQLFSVAHQATFDPNAGAVRERNPAWLASVIAGIPAAHKDFLATCVSLLFKALASPKIASHAAVAVRALHRASILQAIMRTRSELARNLHREYADDFRFLVDGETLTRRLGSHSPVRHILLEAVEQLRSAFCDETL